jgi:hypothetical protein
VHHGLTVKVGIVRIESQVKATAVKGDGSPAVTRYQMLQNPYELDSLSGRECDDERGDKRIALIEGGRVQVSIRKIRDVYSIAFIDVYPHEGIEIHAAKCIRLARRRLASQLPLCSGTLTVGQRSAPSVCDLE